MKTRQTNAHTHPGHVLPLVLEGAGGLGAEGLEEDTVINWA